MINKERYPLFLVHLSHSDDQLLKSLRMSSSVVRYIINIFSGTSGPTFTESCILHVWGKEIRDLLHQGNINFGIENEQLTYHFVLPRKSSSLPPDIDHNGNYDLCCINKKCIFRNPQGRMCLARVWSYWRYSECT